MFEKMKLPDGSVWHRIGAGKTDSGFRFVNLDRKTVFLPNGAGTNDSYEVYVSHSWDLVAVVTWDRRYQYIGGTLYSNSGEELTEFFAQEESSEEFFKLSESNMVKHMIHMLHERCP